MKKIKELIGKEAVLGSYVPQPVDLHLLLRFKILRPIEFTVLNYMFVVLLQSNKRQGQFSARNLSRLLNISKNTASKVLQTLVAREFVLRAFSPLGYGETYTLNIEGLKTILEPLREKATEEDVLRRQGVPKNGTVDDRCTKKWDGTVPKIGTGCTKKWDGSVPKIGTNIIIYNNLKSLYQTSIKNSEIDAMFKSSISKLVQEGFTENEIGAFLELHSKNGFFDFSKIRSFYAIVSSFGRKNLQLIESQMSGQRLAREERKLANEKAVAMAASGQVNKAPKYKFRGLN